jgi:hypothetical protein
MGKMRFLGTRVELVPSCFTDSGEPKFTDTEIAGWNNQGDINETVDI